MRLRRTLVAAAALLMLAAACGDGDDSATTDAQDLSGQTVEVAAVWSGAEQASFEAVLDQFEADTGATVSFTSTGDDIATVLGTRIEGGSPPDIAVLPQPGLLSDLAGRGALMPLGSDIGDLVDANFAPVWRQLGSVDGTLYGVWFKAANKSTVWYNANVFANAGVEPPATWEEFLEVSGTIADSGVSPVAIGGGDGWTLTDWFENVYLRVAGPDMYDQLAAHEISWDHESVTDSLDTLAELWGDSTLIAGGALTNSFPESVTQVFGDPAGAAIVYEGDFVAGTIADETTSVVGEDALFFPFPSIDGSAESIVGGGDAAVLLTDNPAASELVEYLATPAAAEIWAALGGFTSPNQEVDLGAYPDEVSRQSAEALVGAETFRFDLSDLQPAEFGGTPSQGMWKLLQDFLSNPGDVEGIAAGLEAAAAAAFAG